MQVTIDEQLELWMVHIKWLSNLLCHFRKSFRNLDTRILVLTVLTDCTVPKLSRLVSVPIYWSLEAWTNLVWIYCSFPGSLAKAYAHVHMRSCSTSARIEINNTASASTDCTRDLNVMHFCIFVVNLLLCYYVLGMVGMVGMVVWLVWLLIWLLNGWMVEWLILILGFRHKFPAGHSSLQDTVVEHTVSGAKWQKPAPKIWGFGGVTGSHTSCLMTH